MKDFNYMTVKMSGVGQLVKLNLNVNLHLTLEWFLLINPFIPHIVVATFGSTTSPTITQYSLSFLF